MATDYKLFIFSGIDYMMFPYGNASLRRDLAYTPRAIGFHKDNPYRDPTPVPRRLFGAGEAMMHSVLNVED